MLEIDNLAYSYSSGDGIHNISFSGAGIIAIVGANGAGKTTLFNCIAGILSGSGTIRVNGSIFSPEKSPVAYMPAFDFYYPGLTGRQNLEILGRICGLGKKHYTSHHQLIHELGLTPHMDKPFSECSTGIRKKLQFVGSLFSTAPLFIYDEPHNGVDLVSNMLLNHELRALSDQEKIVLFSGHIMEHVQSISDSIVWLEHGTVREHSRPPFSDMAAAMTAAYSVRRGS